LFSRELLRALDQRSQKLAAKRARILKSELRHGNVLAQGKRTARDMERCGSGCGPNALLEFGGKQRATLQPIFSVYGHLRRDGCRGRD
jgi:hypothetical protein